MRVRLSQQRWPLVAVVACVLLTHLLVTSGIASHMHDMTGDGQPIIERLEAQYVADMKLSEPPVVIAPTATAPAAPEAAEVATRKASEAEPPRRPKPKKPKAPMPPQQAPEPPVVTEAASEPEAVVAEASASTPETAVPETTANATAESPEAAASAPVFEWPLATRVTYKAEGYYRGEVHGSALVEWIKRGERYQVHSDVLLGPRAFPIASRRFTSDGVITETGLVPERFESVDKLLVVSNAPKVLNFAADSVELPNGEKVAKMPGVQDPASHYIQLAYQLMLKPGVLRVGASIDMPLAWSKRQEMIAYDVIAEEVLDTPLGKLKTFKLKPRRLNGEPMEALADVWLAPSLQYLPVRIYLQQKGTDVFIDMQMDKPPQQLNADPGR
jgi:Protein of unknown function (DUF3108)